MQAVHPDKPLGPTDRGTLWRNIQEAEGDTIVRMIELRFCDDAFRQSLESLQSVGYPRMVEIVDKGWSGEQYCVSYRAGKSSQTLEEFFQQLHWRERLVVLMQICEVIPQWRISPVRPLGLNERNIMMIETVGRWLPWLLPCPAVKYTSPYDLFGIDSRVISTLAPEFIRGVDFNERDLNMYGLGALACLAIGFRPSSRVATDEERLETQVCGALLICDAETSEVEPFLWNVKAVKDLIQVIQRYTHVDPGARPAEPTELRDACASAIQATDPERLARDLVQQGKLRDAVRILEWGLETFGEHYAWRRLAAVISMQLRDWRDALERLNILIEGVSDSNPLLAVPLVMLRVEARAALLEELKGEFDAEGDLLLEDIEWLEQVVEDKRTLNGLCHKAAGVYRRQGKVEQASIELFKAIELEPSDMKALLQYGECWRDLGKSVEELQQIVETAHDRIDRMVVNQMMNEEEARLWQDAFNSLL
jgi:hypothetical protein